MSDVPVPVSLTVSEKTKVVLGQASPWVRFLAVLAFIGVGVLIVLGIGLIVFGSNLGALLGMGFLGTLLGVLYIALGILLFFPARYVLRMAGKTKKYKTSGDAADLEGFAVNFKSLVLFYGITAIVVLTVYAIALIFFVGALLLRPAGM